MSLSSLPAHLSQEWYLAVIVWYAATFMSQVLRLSHRLIIKLLIIHAICYWDRICFWECTEHVVSKWGVETCSSFPCICHTFGPWSCTLNWFSILTSQLYWPSMVWCPDKSLWNVLNGSVEILSFSFRSVDVVFTGHYLEIILEITFNHFSLMSLWRFWIDWLSSFPVISIQSNSG